MFESPDSIQTQVSSRERSLNSSKQNVKYNPSTDEREKPLQANTPDASHTQLEGGITRLNQALYSHVYIMKYSFTPPYCQYILYTLYKPKQENGLDSKHLSPINTIENKVSIPCDGTGCCHMCFLYKQNCYRGSKKGRNFTGFSIKRASKCCDAPLSLLCSVCRNTHCREKRGKESNCTKPSLKFLMLTLAILKILDTKLHKKIIILLLLI